jgi:ribosomal protein S18 acetylase RimI-like enzyme
MKDFTQLDLTTSDSLQLLENFIGKLEDASSTFRYFNKRDINIVKKHVVSYLVLYNEVPVAYGHLEKVDAVVWLGVCVLPNFQGRKIGTLIMNDLIRKAKKKKIPKIYLTVDKENKSAINLYEQIGFTKIEVFENYYKYKLNVD